MITDNSRRNKQNYNNIKRFYDRGQGNNTNNQNFRGGNNFIDDRNRGKYGRGHR